MKGARKNNFKKIKIMLAFCRGIMYYSRVGANKSGEIHGYDRQNKQKDVEEKG
jgi:hypothetical protein